MENKPLSIAGALSILAATLHLAVIAGGPDWYRFFGAGEQMALMAEQGQLYPAIVTSTIALILLVWGMYALSGAKVVRRLPLLRFCLVAITAVYLLRGIGGLVVAFIPSLMQAQQLTFEFMLWSSAICAGYGAMHVIGVYKGWSYLGSCMHITKRTSSLRPAAFAGRSQARAAVLCVRCSSGQHR